MDINQGVRQATTNQHEIEPQQLLDSTSADIVAAPTSARESRCSIFRVPQGLTGGKAEMCRPCVISIGPYHYGESQLWMLQEHKRRYLHTMLARTQPHGIGFENLFDVVAPKEEMIRQCYSESIDKFMGPEFVEMIVIDGCFIIEFLRKLASDVQPKDMLINNRFLFVSLRRDLLLLENQIPYFVLEDLFETTDVPEGALSLANAAFNFLSCLGIEFDNGWKRQINLKGVHLLDFCRLSLMPLDEQDNQGDESSSSNMIKSASELHRVGIRCMPREASTFLDIIFNKKRRTIEIPRIAIADEILIWILTNMVAFEQCRGQQNGHITAYAAFMGYLIRTPDDVQLLRDYKIISNHGMSNKDFAHFFGDICKDAALNFANNYLALHFAKINESLKYERAYLCWAQLLNAFRENPWSALSGLAVIVTLTGLIQTVYTVLQYYHPK